MVSLGPVTVFAVVLLRARAPSLILAAGAGAAVGVVVGVGVVPGSKGKLMLNEKSEFDPIWARVVVMAANGKPGRLWSNSLRGRLRLQRPPLLHRSGPGRRWSSLA